MLDINETNVMTSEGIEYLIPSRARYDEWGTFPRRYTDIEVMPGAVTQPDHALPYTPVYRILKCTRCKRRFRMLETKYQRIKPVFTCYPCHLRNKVEHILEVLVAMKTVGGTWHETEEEWDAVSQYISGNRAYLEASYMDALRDASITA